MSRPREAAAPLLRVEDLRTYFDTDEGVVKAVDGVSFELARGRTLGVVGESGCGKTVLALSVLGLVQRPGRVVSGSACYEGVELVGAPETELRGVRGAEIAMVFQDPLTALNPVLTVGRQVVEAIRAHADPGREEARARAVELLRRVGIPGAERRFDDYPHQFSGGMRQRAMIAMALACDPSILIADEPTTALDVTIQAQILALMEDLRRDSGSSILLITHDLRVVAGMADDVMVMYAGRRVEAGPVEEVFSEPRHPYTIGLLGSLPALDSKRAGALPSITGTPPSLIGLTDGCRFAPRCRFGRRVCRTRYPDLREVTPGHLSACHFAREVSLASVVEVAAAEERASGTGGTG
ncbi:MAG: ABC transporter ATP-binding protein [Coriobacteriia bacterium]|nr:ABC transporter ATP-binding protein [Coriobacteriia bacterium]